MGDPAGPSAEYSMLGGVVRRATGVRPTTPTHHGPCKAQEKVWPLPRVVARFSSEVLVSTRQQVAAMGMGSGRAGGKERGGRR